MTEPTENTATLDGVKRLFHQLSGQQMLLQQQKADLEKASVQLEQQLARAGEVEQALDALSEKMFGQLRDHLQRHLSHALQEVLQQPLELKVETGTSGGATTMTFYIERDGQPEDILQGQGGSVANVLSVGLRLFALAMLPEAQHRRFLVLDEQDCWLRPDLVPRLVKIVREAAEALGFQILMISHHSEKHFLDAADRILQLQPGPDGITLTQVGGRPTNAPPDPD
jgi:DNA repair exonuclease SbcCD ATPase subunit